MADRKRTEPDWQDVRVFLALARHGTLSGAARALAVNHATVARRIASLERTLRRRLVERRPEGYVLTEMGRRTLTPAADMEAAAAALGQTDGDQGVGGLVRINATPSLAQGFLASRLSRLTARHAGLDLELASAVRSVSLERYEADIALRLERPRDGDVLARRLVTLGFGFYASPAWRDSLERGGEPCFVGFDEANAHLPEAVWLARRFPRARMAVRTDSQFAQALAARAGAGIALLPHFIGRSDGDLVRCLPDQAPAARELWLVTRRRDGRAPSTRAAADRLVEMFQAERDLFERQDEL